jgi:hypothetical protein
MRVCGRTPDVVVHPSPLVLNGTQGFDAVDMKAKPGEVVKFSAAGTTDPDGDRLDHRWWIYREAGTYDNPLSLNNAADSDTASLTIPADASGKTIHVILEVTDDGKPALTRYRRAVLEVGR